MSSVLLTSDVTEVYMVHPDDLPQADQEGGGGGLEESAVINKYDTREVKDADGTEYFLVENMNVKDLLNRQKVPMGLIKKSEVSEVSAHNWEAFGFKHQSITPKEFVFGKADHAFLNEVWKALKSDEKSDKNCDIPTVKKLISRDEGCFKLSRWVCQHASEWADEADFKSQVKTFLEENAKEDDDAKAKAKAKYERLEAKIANLSWWKDVKAEGFPSSSMVYHFHPVAFLEQMKRSYGAAFDCVKVEFQAGISQERKDIVSRKSVLILKRTGFLSENDKIMISSTIRSPEQQVSAMYNNLAAGRRIRYGAPGRKVVAIYDDEVSKGSSQADVKSKMEEKIKDMQKLDQLVSLHCVSEESYRKLNVIDVSITGSNLKNEEIFLDELAKDEDVKRVIHPFELTKTNSAKLKYDANEPAIHIEIIQ